MSPNTKTGIYDAIPNQNKETSLNLDPVEAEAEALFQTLVHEAINIPGDHGIPHKDIPAGTTEEERTKLRKGRQFFQRNYWACAWAIMFTEVVQYPIQRITSFVVRNENYNGPNFAYLRGVVTFTHIRKWFSEGFENQMAESALDVYKVRKIHSDAIKKLSHLPAPPPNKPNNERMHVLRAVQADLAHIPTPDFLPTIMTQNPTVPISQFDMALVLGVFYFLLDVRPKCVGLYTDKDYEYYIYYVGQIGRYLGIEDRFNMALHPNPAVRKAVSRRFMNQVIAPCFKEFKEPEFLNLCYFSEHGFHIDPIEVSMHMLIKDILGAGPARNTWRYVNCMYRFFYRSLNSAIYLVRFRPLLYLGNASLRLWLLAGVWSTRERRSTVDNCSEPMTNGGQSRCPV